MPHAVRHLHVDGTACVCPVRSNPSDSGPTFRMIFRSPPLPFVPVVASRCAPVRRTRLLLAGADLNRTLDDHLVRTGDVTEALLSTTICGRPLEPEGRATNPRRWFPDPTRRPSKIYRIRRVGLTKLQNRPSHLLCEAQIGALTVRNLQPDRTGTLSRPRRGGGVHVIMADDMAASRSSWRVMRVGRVAVQPGVRSP